MISLQEALIASPERPKRTFREGGGGKRPVHWKQWAFRVGTLGSSTRVKGGGACSTEESGAVLDGEPNDWGVSSRFFLTLYRKKRSTHQYQRCSITGAYTDQTVKSAFESGHRGRRTVVRDVLKRALVCLRAHTQRSAVKSWILKPVKVVGIWGEKALTHCLGGKEKPPPTEGGH